MVSMADNTNGTTNGAPADTTNRIPADAAAPAPTRGGKKKKTDVDELLDELTELRALAKTRRSAFTKVIGGRTHNYTVAGAAGPGPHDAETWEEVDAAGGTESYETSRPGFAPGKTVDTHDGASFVGLMAVICKLPVG
jgi:hypothetical protein